MFSIRIRVQQADRDRAHAALPDERDQPFRLAGVERLNHAAVVRKPLVHPKRECRIY